ncbi:MAG: THUMP domain-containing protein [Candidatus Thorarchaeota archaeon]|nr:THUMP domain-containing protein [Candidatus Thorarchaeota archaeon]
MTIEYSAVLVRYGEIGIKSRQTRKYMSHLLASQITSALKEHTISFSKVRTEFGRLFVMTDDARRAAEVTARIFGVVSTSPVVVTEAKFDTILETGLDLARQSFRPGLSFAVGARRLGSHTFTSQDVRRKLGELILSQLDNLHLTVNLTAPQQSVYVEVREDVAYLFTETVDGVGGMPTGSQGTVVCLIDGSLASLVASYRVMKRGAIPVFVVFEESSAIHSAVAKLASYIHGQSVKKYVLSLPRQIKEFQGPASESLCIICRRNMINVAAEIASIEDADGIVTGDVIGVPAQTIAALKHIREVQCKFPIFQPCAGDDFESLRIMAQQIGVQSDSVPLCSDCQIDSTYSDLLRTESELGLPSAKEQLDTARIDETI